MGELAEILGATHEAGRIDRNHAVRDYKAEEVEEEQKRYAEQCGPVTTRIDIDLLEPLATMNKTKMATPYVRISPNNLILSVEASEKYKDGDKLEVRANKYTLAIRKHEDGVPCTLAAKKKKATHRVNLQVNRKEIIRRLAELGWQVGMRVELHWDDEQKFWWGKRPKEGPDG